MERLNLEVLSHTTRFKVALSRRHRAILLCWTAETELPNVLWVRLIVLRFGWPPVNHIEAFKVDEGDEDEMEPKTEAKA